MRSGHRTNTFQPAVFLAGTVHHRTKRPLPNGVSRGKRRHNEKIIQLGAKNMFNNSLGSTIIITAIGLWFAHGCYLNTRLGQVHQKLDRILESFNGLRQYLYEIDSQFDEERQLLEALNNSIRKGSPGLDGMNHMELIQRKEARGQRTLDTSF